VVALDPATGQRAESPACMGYGGPEGTCVYPDALSPTTFGAAGIAWNVELPDTRKIERPFSLVTYLRPALRLRPCRLPLARAGRGGLAENFDALTGAPLRDKAYTWTASVFLMLANDLLTTSPA
jgi:hypothetical protein